MANTNAPFGLRWLGFNGGSAAPTFALQPGKFISSLSTKAYKGDGIQQLASGYQSPVTAASVGASQWVGVFSECQYLSTAAGRRIVTAFWPGTGDNTGDVDTLYVPLIGNPPQLFVAQTLSTSAAFADIGATVDIAYATGTSYVSGYSRSGLTIDMGSKGTSNTLPFRIVNLWSAIAAPGAPGTDDSSNFNWVVVRFNAEAETGI